MFFNLRDHWRLNSPSEVSLCFSYTSFPPSLKRSAHLKRKKISEGHQSPLNKVFGSPSFGFAKRPVKEQELHYVINLFWRFKGGFPPVDEAGWARRPFSRVSLASWQYFTGLSAAARLITAEMK